MLSDNTVQLFLNSWTCHDDICNSVEDILSWVDSANRSLKVNIKKTSLEQCSPWFYSSSEGLIRNPSGSFFSIGGMQVDNDGTISEQPILYQNEIGYLGLLCKEFDGILHFLMQAKIEPGNVNKVQISPTIQATKSNFTQLHGGAKPAYLSYFTNASAENIVVDQIQSEQSSRFYKKRNRNIIVHISEDIEVLSSHKWMTLYQIKCLLKIDNLVNMDTRTVLSCIPFFDFEHKELYANLSGVTDPALLNSILSPPDFSKIKEVFHFNNNYKMFFAQKVHHCPLFDLSSWSMKDNEFTDGHTSFKVVFCDIEIEGREVRTWSQPLFEAVGNATFGLITSTFKNKRYFLVHATPEIGCHDYIELGPTLQLEANQELSESDDICRLFYRSEFVTHKVLLSEEGGRFLAEQNLNIILDVPSTDIVSIPSGYFWLDYATLNWMNQFNNCLNIQLRNLLSLLEV